MSIDLSKVTALSDEKGVIVQIADASGRVLWSAVGWPDDLDTGLEFASASAFTVSVGTPSWGGTMEYCNSEDGWKMWDGSTISSGKTESGQALYIRGTGNTTAAGEYNNRWTLTGTDIDCNGNIENLLDYTTVAAGEHPTMADRCYNSMFYGCTNLKSAPALPATTLKMYCYQYMFYGCTNLKSVPALPATTFEMYCYNSMFCGCTSIKLSSTQTDTYTTTYRIPQSGDGTVAFYAQVNMFTNTGGTFTGTPKINTTYYLDSSNTIV